MTPRSIIVGLIVALLTAGGVADASGQSRDGQSRRVRIHNQTGLPVQTLQAAAVGTADFGPDLLGGAPIPAGESRRLSIDYGANVCLFDLRATLAGGQAVVRGEVNVCRISDYYLTR